MTTKKFSDLFNVVIRGHDPGISGADRAHGNNTALPDAIVSLNKA